MRVVEVLELVDIVPVEDLLVEVPLTEDEVVNVVLDNVLVLVDDDEELVELVLVEDPLEEVVVVAVCEVVTVCVREGSAAQASMSSTAIESLYSSTSRITWVMVRLGHATPSFQVSK